MGHKLLLGVDGGGSKTEFILTDEKGSFADRLILGPCNPNTVGTEGAFLLLKNAILRLEQKWGAITGCFIGSAGFLTNDRGKEIQRKLRLAFPFMQVRCETDIYNLFALGSGCKRSIAVICGTGSVVFSKLEEKLQKYTGWGYLLGDRGSGYELGRMGLRAALAAKEGIGPQTMLTDLLEREQKASLSSLVSMVYQKDASFVASMAPVVIRGAELGDVVANEILDANILDLAAVIKKAMGEKGTEELILSGGILSGCSLFRERLLAQLPGGISVCLPKEKPVLGALLLAAECCNLPGEPIRKAFQTWMEKDET